MTCRPYPETGLTTTRWQAEVGTELVPFVDLWLTQPGVDILALFGYSRRISDRYPHVVRWQGLNLLEDGHCRVVRTALTRQATAMTMRVFTSPD
jgi:hypothetical protein